jgi:phosphohistidine swiveling domain-containing protein
VTTAPSTEELRFDPPGPGSWKLDPVHFPRPATRYWTEMHPEPFLRGTSEFTRYYGMLIGGLHYEYVNGFAYLEIVPPPKEEMPERFRRAEEVFERKLWRDQLRDWDSTHKPANIRTHRELQAVDPDSLSDEELAAYLQRCHDHHAEMIYQHMRHTGAAMVTIGDFLAHAGDWTSLPPAELLETMQGAAPVSAGVSTELQRLQHAISEDETARALLDSDGDPGEVLEQLRSLESPAGEATAAYLDLVGYRLINGFDITNPYALELPASLLGAIKTSVATGEETADVDSKIAEIRDKVPEEHRDEFDDLLSEARLMYRIRDERGVFSDIWASGIMRRAALAAGRRIASQGRVHDPEHIVDADINEMKALVTGAGGPSADELGERNKARSSRTAKDAPPFLGDPPAPPPDPSGLPPATARVMRATGIVIDAMFGSSEEEHTEKTLRGLAASRGVYEGPARRVSDPSEFARIAQGDVLVTESTTEAFNILLPLLGAIVTDAGGLLSHAAIVSREYGIPGVVGTREATDRIADGARVRVDGDKGEVTVLG